MGGEVEQPKSIYVVISATQLHKWQKIEAQGPLQCYQVMANTDILRSVFIAVKEVYFFYVIIHTVQKQIILNLEKYNTITNS